MSLYCLMQKEEKTQISFVIIKVINNSQDTTIFPPKA